MNTLRTKLGCLALIAGATLTPQALLGQPASSCRQPGAASAALMNYMTLLASASDSVLVAKRTFYHLDAGAQVTLVSDSATCDSALAAYDQVRGVRAGRSVHVVRVGNVYVVKDPDDAAGHFGITLVFNVSFTQLLASAVGG